MRLIWIIFFQFIVSPGIGKVNETSIELSYGRIHIHIDSKDSLVSHHKKLVDSIFSMAERNFQEIESLLGYKSSLQFTATIHSDLSSYHEDLKKNQVWLERVSGDINYTQEYNYPIFVHCSYDQIQSQFIYVISHFVCHEFLLGISVRQKLSQTGFHTIPNWFLQGLCSYLSNGWNANSADEFAFFESKGGFKSPNQIVPLGAQVYGRKIWRDLFETYGKSVVSTMMFVLKYTGNAESAFEYVTGKSFKEWNTERSQGRSIEKEKLSNSEFGLSKKYEKVPIRKIARYGDLAAIQWYSPGLVKISLFRPLTHQMIDMVSHSYPSLTNELDYPPIKMVDFLPYNFHKSIENYPHRYLAIESTSESKTHIVLLDTLGHPFKSYLLSMGSCYTQHAEIGLKDLNIHQASLNKGWLESNPSHTMHEILHSMQYAAVGFQWGEIYMIWNRVEMGDSPSTTHLNMTKLTSERLDFSISAIDSMGYSVDAIPTKKGQWLVVFKRITEKSEIALRIDTVWERPIIRGLIIEGEGQLSYVQNEGEVWRLRFYHFKDNSDYRWQSEVKNSFYNQSKVADPFSIIESSFATAKSSIRFLDPAVVTVRELESLTKSDGITPKNMLESPKKVLGNSEIKDSVVETWEYLVPFPKRNWKLLLDQEKTAHFKGIFDSSKYLNAYYLSRGGLYFSNLDYSPMGYLNEIKPQFLYNQPFTPEMRFYVTDKNHTYRLAFGVLSNIALNRLGLQVKQGFKLGKYECEQQVILRNRSFYLNEMSLKKNTTNFLSLSIQRSWIPGFQFSAGIQMVDDSYFDKAINPGFASFKNYKFQSSSMILGLDWRNEEKSIHNERSWKLHMKSSVKMGRTSTPTIIPNRVYLRGHNLGQSINFNLSFSIDKQLIRGIYLHSYFNANKSVGDVLTLYWVGGSEGWISKDMWKTDVSSEYSNFKYLYRDNGGFVRGFLTGERIGTGSFISQNEIRWKPIKQINKDIIKKHFYETLMIYGFVDVGTAFIGTSPANASNPFNTVTISTPNYWISVTSRRNPYLIGTGLGLSANVLRTPIRYELAMGLKEGKFLSPVQQVCMSWFF